MKISRWLVLVGVLLLLSAGLASGLAFPSSSGALAVAHSLKLGRDSWAFMTDFYDVSLALTTTLLLVALGWSISLRRRVNEQTERIKEQLGREAELDKRYAQLFENANDMVFSLDRSGGFSALNKTAERVLGSSREACRSRKLRDFIAEPHLRVFDEWVGKCLAGDNVARMEFQILGANGGRSFLELSAQPIREGNGIAGIQGIGRDVTERKQAEEALRQSEERFSSAFRVSPVAIAVSSLKDGSYIDVNESFLRLFGFQREEVIGHTAAALKLWADPMDEKRLEWQLQKKQSVGGVECNFRIKSGETRKALLFVEPIDLNNDACALSIVHDMTERLALEEKLRKAMKMEAVGRLAAGVAHDFNNLLTVIQGHAEMAFYQNSRNPVVAKALDRIADASRRAAGLTRQLLTFSRKQTPQPKPVDLNELINSATRMFKHLLPEEVNLRFKFSPGLPITNADPTMVEQVIMNLVVNARDAMPNGGEIEIGTNYLEVDAAGIKEHPEASEGPYLCLFVSDTGCGMDPATQSKIFEPFFTTKELGKGTGLGLATVYGIVKQHKGWIEVSSELGKGSVFRIYFPSARREKPVGADSALVPAAESRKTILIVEDEPSVAELARTVLQEDGYRILEAGDGLGALQIWNDNRGTIDLLLTDVKMPHGMSGIDLADNLRALKPDLKVIQMSGGNAEGELSNRGVLSQEVFLAKPFSAAHLQQIVRSRFNAPRTPMAA